VEKAIKFTFRWRNGVTSRFRTPEEFAQGHLDNAINIPLNTVETGFADIAKDRSIVVYCRSGNRSGMAMESLVKHGLSEMQEAQLNQAPLN